MSRGRTTVSIHDHKMKEVKSTGAKNRRNKSSQKNNKPKAKAISQFKCPEGMSVKDWQIALRRQVVEKERLIVTPPEDSEYFTVSNPRSGRNYQVFYKGARSKWNYCSCRDFKTNHLGTCKHIEAITAAEGGAYAQKRYAMPDYTTVYLDYRGERTVKIRIGTHKKSEFQLLAERYFDKNGELLSDSFMSFESFMEQARQIDPRCKVYDDALEFIVDRRESVRRALLLESMPDDQIAGILKSTHLYPFQVEGVKFAFRAGSSINADEMGLGKTVQAIATAELLRSKGLVDSVLILCPTSLKYQWLNEIRRFTDSSVRVVEGGPVERHNQYASDEFYKICSYNSVSNDVRYGAIPMADMIIFDEIQRLKNWDTKISRNISRLHSRYVLALTGTPLENKLTELYSVMNYVDPFCLGPYYEFNANTTVYDESGRVVGYKNLGKVSEMFADRLIRRRKSQVAIQMPERSDTNLFVPMTNEQQAIHEEYQTVVARLAHKWRTMHFLSESDRRRLMLSLSMMRMVADSTFILDQKTHFDTKINEVMHIVRQMVNSENGKIVIFSQWERMLRLVALELENEQIGFSFLHGGVPSRKRKALIDNFNGTEECHVFLSTDAGATGLNLQSASTAVNLDLPWNPALLEQRIARIYRMGQKNGVQVINMVSRDSIEERMLSVLSFKQSLFAGILDDGDDTVVLDENRFNRIMKLVDEEIARPDDGEDTSQGVSVSLPIAEFEEHARTRSESHPAEGASANRPAEDADGCSRESETDNNAENEPREKAVAAAPAAEGTQRRNVEPIDGDRLMTQGVMFLSGLVEALKTPESTKALVDSLVKTDKKTGKSTMTIPIHDKTTLTNLLTALGALLNR